MFKIQIKRINGEDKTIEIYNAQDICRTMNLIFLEYNEDQTNMSEWLNARCEERGIQSLKEVFDEYDCIDKVIEDIPQVSSIEDIPDLIKKLKRQVSDLQDAMQDIYDIADDNRG